MLAFLCLAKVTPSLWIEVDKLVGKFGFSSRAEIVKEGIRRELHIYRQLQTYRGISL